MEPLTGSGADPLLIVTVATVAVIGVSLTSQAARRGRSARLRLGQHLAAMAGLFMAYWALAVVGLHWAAIHGAGSPVWPAAGVGLAGLLLGGLHLWPAILVARMAAALATGSDQPWWAEVSIAAGNASSSVLAAALLSRWFQIDRRLAGMRDILRLAGASLTGAAWAAAVGVATLGLSSGLDVSSAFEVGVAWWLGTGVGSLVVAPLVLAWSHRGAWAASANHWLALAALLAAAIFFFYVIFFNHSLVFLRTWYVYPALIWIAVTYQVRGIAPALLVLTTLAIWSATIDVGPFSLVYDSAPQRVALSQQFAIITALASLILAAAADERRGLEAIARSEARESSVVNTAADPIIVIDERGRMVTFNPAAEHTFGYRASEVLGEDVKTLMPGEDAAAHDRYLERYHRTGERRVIGIGRQVSGRRKDGTIFPLDLSVAEWRSGESRFYTGIIRDQTERVAADHALRASERRLAMAIEASGGGVYEQAVPPGEELHVSSQWLAILGYDALPVEPARFERWLLEQIHPEDRERRQSAFTAFLERREPRFEMEVRKRHATGHWIWVRSYAHAIEHDEKGRVTRLSGMMIDITDRKTADIRIEHLAKHDPLTGLPNRALFTECLTSAMQHADATVSRTGLVLIDLDKFKTVNDTLGHPIGDSLLQITTKRLLGAIRTGDTAARIGGDEFAVVLPEAGTAPDVEQLARRICRAVVQPVSIEGKTIDVRASLGAAIYPDDAGDLGLLMRHGDLALYAAKAGGRDRVQSFYPGLAEAASRRARVEAELRRAIERDELVLHYQPQIDLETGRVRSVEALVRWPWNGALFPPSEFIPIAEASGIIRPLGAWVLAEACRQQAEWRDRGHDIPVAVNVSPAETNDDDFVSTVDRALARSGTASNRLELEITERLLIDPEKPAVRAFLTACSERDLGLTIDDFGIGYSSLGYLARLPVSKIKIDKSFVSKIGERDDDDALIEAIVNVGHRLGKRVVAEGVETAEQLDYLRAVGCQDVQGYLLCEPRAPADLEPLLRERKRGRLN